MTAWKAADRKAWVHWLGRCRTHQMELGVSDEAWQQLALEVSSGRTNHTARLTKDECTEFERRMTRGAVVSVAGRVGGGAEGREEVPRG